MRRVDDLCVEDASNRVAREEMGRRDKFRLLEFRLGIGVQRVGQPTGY